jgi:UDP-N-acetylmuramoyl-L-alanyl-D-glutamate--2,6-diaminopimelate ligase
VSVDPPAPAPDDAVDALDARPAQVRPLPLSALAEAVAAVVHAAGDPGADAAQTLVSGVTLASGGVRPGDLYAALPGARTHGARYAADAVAAGAVALLTDPTGVPQCLEAGVPVMEVDEPRRHLGRLARLVHADAPARLATTGVTGTQGKTTVTYLLEAGLVGAGARPAVIGTTGTRVRGRPVASALTTPEAPDLHALFAVMLEQGADACAMEVSSHALVQGRVDGIVFDVAVFLNLGRDHLDFHADVDDYFAAKASLFTPAHARYAVVNADDAHGRRLLTETTLPVTTWSMQGRPADWQVVDARPGEAGSTFTLVDPQGGRHAAAVPLPGAFNVSNAAAAIVALATAGWPMDGVLRGVAGAPGVPGRMERVDAGQPFRAIVDYAHKPDALEAVLAALRPGTPGRLIVVLGAGGERDTGKRPVMGEVAARLADVVVVTDDNPRGEDAASIRAAIVAGAHSAGTGATVVELAGRRAAIGHALHVARPGDCVVVAGKGHETGQEVAGVVHPFDDRQVVRQLLTDPEGPA